MKSSSDSFLAQKYKQDILMRFGRFYFQFLSKQISQMSMSASVWLQGFYKSIPRSLSPLFNQLVYGMQLNHFSPQTSSLRSLLLYFNERNMEILMAFDQMEENRPKLFYIRELKIKSKNYQYEMSGGLKGSYAVLAEGREEIIIIFAHPQERDQFIELMKFMSKSLRHMPVEADSVILKHFIAADLNKSLSLSSHQLSLLLLHLKIEPSEELKALINSIQRQSLLASSDINYRQFQRIMKLVMCRTEMKGVFEKYNGKRVKSYADYLQKFMDKPAFTKFLEEEQHESLKHRIELANAVFGDHPKISLLDFSRFLLSTSNEAADSSISLSSVDTSHPLTNYFIFSSHNTYLTGNQLTSDSKVERYLQDLDGGVRCVQIDVHDDEKGPIVTHGYTATSKVGLEEVVRSIAGWMKQHKNHTPLILSLQNHCNEENQSKMADIFKKHFSSSILLISMYPSATVFPSLEECLGKVILKCNGSYLKYLQARNSSNVESVAVEAEDKEEDEEAQLPKPMNKFELSEEFGLKKKAFYQNLERIFNEKQEFLQSQAQLINSIRSEFVRETPLQSSSKMLQLTAMLSSGNLARACIWESMSLSQNKLLSTIKSAKAQLQEYTGEGWLRVYPAGSRVNSSNYHPIQSIQVGAQIIALNSQVNDEYYACMREFFNVNSQTYTGYRLKNQIQPLAVPHQYCIRVLSASKIYQNDPIDMTIPTVEVLVRFIGSSADQLKNPDWTEQKLCTEQIKSNAYNPIFKMSSLVNLKIKDISVAFVQFSIKGCGMAVIALESLKRGYRNIRLRDGQYKEKESRLLCHFDWMKLQSSE